VLQLLHFEHGRHLVPDAQVDQQCLVLLEDWRVVSNGLKVRIHDSVGLLRELLP
jgi:hypothetical protein